MTDPLEALHTPATPVDPDPGFADDLRERLRRAVLSWKEPTMPTPTEALPESALPTAPAIAPYLVVADARRALRWYLDVFDGHRRGEVHEMPGGAIGHAEIGIGDAVLMLADADAAGGVPVAAPTPGQPHSHTLHVRVGDVDAVFTRAVDAGAHPERHPTDYPYGRVGVLVDPFGHRWMLNAEPAHPSRARAGDVGYTTMVVADAERAKTFYGAVLGWTFSGGSVPGGWQVEGRDIGLWGAAGAAPRVDLCFRVADLGAALERVREQGGTASAVDTKPYGLYAECADPDGTAFQLWQSVT
ncbi:VOC family protein [Actinokineospora sp. 24-640]